ncbi:MAG: hypothetical protein JSS04_13000 [Proteobacteria bacterium]|nr:hypothetical protein [Pseudomonadota bacterium]
MPNRASLLALIALAVLAGTAEVVVARGFLLDDALIHVRSADLLLRAGFPTADGVTRSFADSSPLFLLLTAAGLALGGSFYVTKLLSLAAFGGLVAALVATAWRERHTQAQAIVVALLVLVLSPFGVKWLTDGMETGLAVLLALLLASTLDGERHRPVGAGMIALLCVLVRPELAALVAVTAVGQVLRSNRRLGMATTLGGLAAVAALYGIFGGFWPDAAVAKVRYGYSPAEFLELLASVVAGAGLVGIGLVLAWLGSSAITIRAAWRTDRALLLGQLSLLLVLVAIAVRGQAVEGIRPMLPFLAFSLACSVALVRRCLPARPIGARMLLPLAAAAVGIWTVDAFAFDRIVRVQAQSMEAMRTHDWSALRGHTGVAWDVGYLAYFSGAPVCDAQGLINGPDFARLSLPERLRHCARVADFAFVDPPRFHILTTALDMRGWRVCGRFDFAHRTGPVNVYLIVAPPLAREPSCPGSAPRIDGANRLRQAAR